MTSSSQSAQLLSDAEKESRNKINAVIDAYDEVIHANSLLEQKYRAEETILMKKLLEVQAELRRQKEKKPEQEKQEFFRYYSVGKPYFKDKSLAHPPDNEDTILMKQYQMYDFSNVMTVSGWTVGDKARLLSVLIDLSKEIVKSQIYTEIADLQRLKFKTDAILLKISKLKEELLSLKNKTLEDLHMKVEKEFDWEEIAMKLNKRHSPREYKAIWELFFHPKINKRVWGPEEHVKLQRIAAEKRMQDWEAIAKELKTGRTAYQCFVYFRTNVNHAASGRKWSQQEMNYLQRVIDLYKEESYIPWGKVAASMQNRTKIQCYNKYMRMIEGRKGRFLPEEDSVILNFVNVYGTDFRKMSSFLTGRSAIQLRVRYNLLLKLRVSTTWTIDDDRKLLQIMANQDCRTNFSTATKHFPGKDRQNIRSRYNTLIRWTKSHPHNDISTAPRRAARRLSHGEPTTNLVLAINNLRNKMQTELQFNQDAAKKKKGKRFSRESSDNAIHDAIMSTISTLEAKIQVNSTIHSVKAKVEDTYQMLNVQEISSTPEEQANVYNIKHFLFLLNAKLHNEKQFYNSTIGKEFKEIEDKKIKDANRIQMKSYSKMEDSLIEPCIKPTLFGTIAGRRRFLIPPNFATITGSRVILNLLSNNCMKEKSNFNMKSLVRKNLILDYHLTQLRERFIDIFTWSYILSNDPPEYYKLYAADMIELRAKAKRYVPRALPDVPAVTIPPPPPKRLRISGKEAGIDAEATEVDHSHIDVEHAFNGINLPFDDDNDDVTML